MNGVPMSKPPPLIRKNSERKPMIDLDAMDEAADLEHARKAQLEEKERSRAEHYQAQAEASAPAKRKKGVIGPKTCGKTNSTTPAWRRQPSPV